MVIQKGMRVRFKYPVGDQFVDTAAAVTLGILIPGRYYEVIDATDHKVFLRPEVTADGYTSWYVSHVSVSVLTKRNLPEWF